VIVLGGNSRQSLASLRGVLDQKLNSLSAHDCTTISQELFSILDTLYSSVSLRRAMTDPARDAAAKSLLAQDVFASSISPGALSILIESVALRWSASIDLASAIEQLAIESEATAANAEGSLDRVQDELFVFARTLGESQELRLTLGDRLGSPIGKREVIADLLGAQGDQANPSTIRLISQAVTGLAGRNIDSVLRVYADAVADRRNRLLVLVTTRIALTASQSDQLSQIMTKHVGQPVHLNYQIDPTILGGVSIRFADELVDGTISTRLAEAGRALAV
jgi:F-type H+-transporting ATPase subunit delta